MAPDSGRSCFMIACENQAHFLLALEPPSVGLPCCTVIGVAYSHCAICGSSAPPSNWQAAYISVAWRSTVGGCNFVRKQNQILWALFRNISGFVFPAPCTARSGHGVLVFCCNKTGGSRVVLSELQIENTESFDPCPLRCPGFSFFNWPCSGCFEVPPPVSSVLRVRQMTTCKR